MTASLSPFSRIAAAVPASAPVRKIERDGPLSVNDQLAVLVAQHRAILFRVENRLSRIVREHRSELAKAVQDAARMLPQDDNGNISKRTELPRNVSSALDSAFYRFHLGVVESIDKELERIAIAEGEAQSRILKHAIEKTGVGKAHVKPVRPAMGSIQAKRIKINFRVPPAGELEVLTGQPLGGKRWADRLNDAVMDSEERVRDILDDGITYGVSTDTLARDLAGEIGYSLSRAETLARTELSRVQNEAAKLSYEANSDVLQGWQFVAAIDDRICDACLSIDAKARVYEFGEGPDIPYHPNCRCIAVPVIKSAEDMGLDPDDLDPGLAMLLDGDPASFRGSTASFGDFFDRFAASAQMDMLGSPAAYRAYRSGEMKIGTFRDMLTAGLAPMERELTPEQALARIEIL